MTPGALPLEKLAPPAREEMKQASGISRKASLNWPAYVRACRKRARAIQAMALEGIGRELAGRAFFDWGCAAGGIAMELKDALAVDMHAGDVDAHSIAWLRKARPDIRAVDLAPGAALPFAAASFDCIYGLSVLTHIPPEPQEFYLAELERVARPGALVILTVASYGACVDSWDGTIDRDPFAHAPQRARLKELGIIHTSYREALRKRLGFAEQGYGATYHSSEYVREVFGRYFAVEAIREKGLGARQDVVLLRKRPLAAPG